MRRKRVTHIELLGRTPLVLGDALHTHRLELREAIDARLDVSKEAQHGIALADGAHLRVARGLARGVVGQRGAELVLLLDIVHWGLHGRQTVVYGRKVRKT